MTEEVNKTIKEIEVRQAVLEEKQSGHEKTCGVRYKAIAEKQQATIEKIDGVHDYLKQFHLKTNERLETLEGIKWAVSGKVLAACISICIFLIGFIGYTAVNGFPWQ